MPLELAAHHMSFPVRDLERSRRFYEGVLGLAPIPRPDFPFPGAWYRAGGCEVHLIQPPPDVALAPTPDGPVPMRRHAAFAVGDYDATLAHLRAHGLDVVETNADVGQLWVRDPDGHVIELIVPRTR